uniref:Uncharacterized protein n=1 Tax=Vitis vinifera TaxID=29760 RepID=F6HKJ1_VITVI
MGVLFHDIRIPTFFADGMQSFSFPNYVNLIAWLLRVLLVQPNHDLIMTLGGFTAAQHQHECQEQCTVPGDLLCQFS